MNEEDPIRLREDPAADARLRTMLDAARDEHADDAMLERVLAGVLASGGPAGGGGGGGGGAAAAGPSMLPTLGIGAGVATAIALAVGVSVWGGGAAEHAEASDAGIALVVASSDAGVVESDAAVVEEVDAAAEIDAARPTAHARVTPPHTPEVEEPAPPPDPRADYALMRQVTGALESDPARALALANEHRSRFPDSPLAEEREADAILAMLALQRDASREIAAFRGHWPRSPHLRRIDEALARP